LVVDVECCTVCGSDLHTLSGTRREAIPTILGHEIIGHVADVTDQPVHDLFGQTVHVGDRITWSVVIHCGQCERCRAGFPQKCVHAAKYGHALAEGRTALSGGFADTILLQPGTSLLKVPESEPAEVICPANCATATVAAAFRIAAGAQGKDVLVFGAGMLGLTAAAMADSQDAKSVTVVDVESSRLERAQQFGATSTQLWPGTEKLEQQLQRACGRRRFDLILEMSGATDAIESGVKLADINAQIMLVGSVMPSAPVSIDPEQIVRRWISIHGVHNYAPEDLITAVKFLGMYNEQYPFAKLVERSFSLKEINQAIEYATTHRPIRIAIRPK
jgi:alcohol dehydrogenase